MTSSTPRRRHPLLDPKILLRGIILIGTLVAVTILFESLGLKSLLDTHWVDSEIRGKGLWGEAVFVAMGAVFIAVALPRQMVSFLGGYAFGTLPGCALSLIATLIGSLGTFYYARFMGRDVIARRFPNRIQKIDRFLSGNPLPMALVLRLSPFSNNFIANTAAGVTGVRAVPFFIGSILGFLPQTLIFALLGGGIELNRVVSTLISVLLFVISTVIGIWLWRRYRVARGLPEDEDEDGGDNSAREGNQ